MGGVGVAGVAGVGGVGAGSDTVPVDAASSEVSLTTVVRPPMRLALFHWESSETLPRDEGFDERVEDPHGLATALGLRRRDRPMRRGGWLGLAPREVMAVLRVSAAVCSSARKSCGRPASTKVLE